MVAARNRPMSNMAECSEQAFLVNCRKVAARRAEELA
jgi:hypothetical protein